eukprot:8184486-Alexandrium_andersonii.AAC.1
MSGLGPAWLRRPAAWPAGPRAPEAPAQAFALAHAPVWARRGEQFGPPLGLSLIHISEPTRLALI